VCALAGLGCGRTEPVGPPQPAPSDAGFVLASPHRDFTHPDLAARRDGDDESLCLAWLSFDGQRDEVFAAVHDAGGWRPPQRLSAGAGVYFPPRVVADPAGGFTVAWAARDGAAYALFGRTLRGGRLGPLERLTDGAGIDGEPVLAASGDVLWLAWESFRDGGFDVWARQRRGDVWGDAIRVTDDPRSDLQPALGVDAAGATWIAFVSWRDGDYASGNYEIYASRLTTDPAGRVAVAPPVRLSRSPHVDMFPELVSVGPSLCAVWTEAHFPPERNAALETLRYARWNDRVFQVSCLEADRWSEPRGIRSAASRARVSTDERATPVAAPEAGPSARPALWLLHGRIESSGGADRTWATHLLRHDADGASGLADVSAGATGPGGRLGVAWSGGRLWLAEAITREAEHPDTSRPTWVRIRSVDPNAVPLVPLLGFPSSPRDALAPGVSVGSSRRGAGMRIERAGATWHAYFGNLHNHSDFSRDRRGIHGSPVQMFRSVYDVAELDFGALTDHVEWLSPVDWWEIRKATDLWNRPGDFVTLTSYEWTSLSHGHRNLFFPDAALDSADVRFSSEGATPDDLWRFLEDHPAIAVPHHPSHAIRQPFDWSQRNDRFQRLVEIFQNRGSYEFDGAPYQRSRRARFREGHSVRDALRMGHHLGIIASPDHGGGMGLAGVWAESLTREAIFEALHARRTFGTTGAKLELFLEVAGQPQGVELHGARAPVDVKASVRGTASGLDLVLVVDGVDEKSWHFDGDRASIEWSDPRPLGATRYYYLRAEQADGHVGWTSPVWVSPVEGPAEP
jgi:hypothetical protein